MGPVHGSRTPSRSAGGVIFSRRAWLKREVTRRVLTPLDPPSWDERGGMGSVGVGEGARGWHGQGTRASLKVLTRSPAGWMSWTWTPRCHLTPSTHPGAAAPPSTPVTSSSFVVIARWRMVQCVCVCVWGGKAGPRVRGKRHEERGYRARSGRGGGIPRACDDDAPPTRPRRKRTREMKRGGLGHYGTGAITAATTVGLRQQAG